MGKNIERNSIIKAMARRMHSSNYLSVGKRFIKNDFL